MSVTPRAHTDCISNPILPLLSKHSQKIRFSTCNPILPLSFPSNPFLLLFFPSSHFPFLPTLSSYSTLLTTPSFLLSITPFPTTVYSPSPAFLYYSPSRPLFPLFPAPLKMPALTGSGSTSGFGRCCSWLFLTGRSNHDIQVIDG